jgi:DNA-binding response OmpR family regulator
MISGNIHEEAHNMALEIGVNKYMIKPYDFDDLLKCVAEQLK